MHGKAARGAGFRIFAAAARCNALAPVKNELKNIAPGAKQFASDHTPTTGQVVNGVVNAGMALAALGTDGATEAPAAAEEAYTLYRGVSSTHPGFEKALQGIAEPRGGDASIIDHVLGDTRSRWTSWTSEREVALKFATGEGKTSGVILTNTFSASRITPLPGPVQDIMGEWEFLFEGRTSGATVTSVP